MILVTAERDATLRRQAAERGWGFLAGAGTGVAGALVLPDIAAVAAG